MPPANSCPCSSLIPAASSGLCPLCGKQSDSPQTKPTRWHLKRGDEQRGLLDCDDLLRLAARGEISGEDLLRWEGTMQWVSARTIPGLFTKPTAAVKAAPRNHKTESECAAQTVLAKLRELSDLLQVEDNLTQSLPEHAAQAETLPAPAGVAGIAVAGLPAAPPPAGKPMAARRPRGRLPRRLSVCVGMVLVLVVLVAGFIHFRNDLDNPFRAPGQKSAEEQEGPPGRVSAGAGWSDEFVVELNRRRRGAGLREVALDSGLNRGCTDHAKYLARNVPVSVATAASVYAEDPSKPGFTADGQRTAGVALVCYANPAHALERWMGRLFSRVLLLHPELERIAIGFAKGPDGAWVCVVDPVQGRGTPAAAQEPVLYPSTNQQDVPCVGFDKIDEAKDNTPGFPISVTFPKHAMLSNVHAAVTDDTGGAIAVRVSAPEQPLNAALQGATIGIHPLRRLEANRSYGVTVTATVNDEPWLQSWHFTTGR